MWIYTFFRTFWHKVRRNLRLLPEQLFPCVWSPKIYQNSSNSKRAVLTVVYSQIPIFQTQWKMFRNLIPFYVKVCLWIALRIIRISLTQNLSDETYRCLYSNSTSRTFRTLWKWSRVLKSPSVKSQVSNTSIKLPFKYSNLQYLNLRGFWKIRVVTLFRP